MGIDPSKEIVWKCKLWSELDRETTYALLRLRAEVFVVEQNCPYQDLDNKDRDGLHLWAEWSSQPVSEGGEALAVTRLLPAGVSYPNEVSIGRVVTAGNVRGKGLGRELMRQSLMALDDHWFGVPIRLSAQSYLQRFYSDFGFVAEGDSYLEDGIPHVAMVRSAGRP
jgi:ElaA protein